MRDNSGALNLFRPPELLNKKMKKYIQTIVMSIVTLTIFGALPLTYNFISNDMHVSVVSAADKVQDGLTSIKDPFPDRTIIDDGEGVEGLAKSIIEYALYLAAIIAVLFIIYGGYQYIFSAGADDKAKAGRKTLLNALIGLVIIVLAFVMVQVVYTFLTTPR